MADQAGQPARQIRFLLLYALGWAGGSAAYIPFLTILLPLRVTVQAGPGADIGWLAVLAFGGAVAASLAHIAFGWLSDVTHHRRGWIVLGLALSDGLLLAMPRAHGLPALLAMIVAWQMALNMMLAPLAAMAGDRVADRNKGHLGGLLACAPGFGALAGAVVTLPGLATPDERLWLVAALVAACVLPVVLVPGTGPARAPAPAQAGSIPLHSPPGRGVVMRMWLARLAVQLAEAALFAYLYFWFRSIDPAMDDHRTARALSLVLVFSGPAAMAVGRWSDRNSRPVLPLVLCALAAAAGLGGMAMARSLPPALAGYTLFGSAAGIFLALHSAQTLRVLPRSDRRGRDLGLFNLTNTVPSLVTPGLTLALVPRFGFAGLFVLLAALALAAAALLAPLSRRL